MQRVANGTSRFVELRLVEQIESFKPQIGIQVFNRSPGYNSGEDNIVRGTARHLRHRLEQYYIDEGKTERLHISIPKGGYVAHFEIIDDWVERAPEPTGGVSQSEIVTHTDIQSASTSCPSAHVQPCRC